MRAILSMFLCLLSFGANANEYVSFFGRALKQTYLPDIEQTCPDGHICMDVIYRWTIQVEEMISGEISDRTVKAARIQHTEYIFAHKHQALYVLSRIEDEAKRRLLGADYWLEEYAPPKTLYCTSPDRAYGIENDESISRFSGTQSCYVKQRDD